PVCSGSHDAPCHGLCDVGGGACVSTNSDGASADCLPTGPVIDTLTVPLGRLRTEKTELTGADGFFCPGQTSPGCLFSTPTPGGQPRCTLIKLFGGEGGPILPVGTASDAILASAYCVPNSSSAAVDAANALPGPGATTWPVRFAFATVTTTTTTTTTT